LTKNKRQKTLRRFLSFFEINFRYLFCSEYRFAKGLLMLAQIFNDWKRSPNQKNTAKLQQELALDDLNFAYFEGLLHSHFNLLKPSLKPLAEKPTDSLADFYFSTAVASKELMQELPLQSYHELLDTQNTASAKSCALWIKKMQAGTGSSMTRNSYLAREKNIALNEVKIGAKGTDLYTNYNDQKISLAEAQILQSFADVKQKLFGQIVLQDIVSEETSSSIKSLWGKKFPGKTHSYMAELQNIPDLNHNGVIRQSYLPTFNTDNQLSLNRMAPGGHGLFGVESILAALNSDICPQTPHSLISSVGNGEDLSSTPDVHMVAWMKDKQVPLAMVTTTKTHLDVKGGQVALYQEEGKVFIGMVEKAQAEENDQLDLFETLGLRPDDAECFFNTNMVLVNYEILTPKLQKLKDIVGEKKILQAISPDLIRNKKSQIDMDGETRTYTQLEGAMGSAILNLDKLWRQEMSEPLVHILNVETEYRTRFFCPIKSAFDYWLQFHSDRFSLDMKTLRLENKSSRNLPAVSLEHSYYKDVENTLNTFKNTQVKDMESLNIDGLWDLSNTTLIGNVSLVCEKMPMQQAKALYGDVIKG
jgi:hypothetical protein